MLLIAQTKSASTSLAATIGKIAHLKVKLGIPKTNIDISCEGFKELQRYHDNMIERSPIFLKQTLIGKNSIFKEHLLPTKRHLKILSKFKENIVILLRYPEHSFDSYVRLFDAKKQNYKEDLLKDIKKFHDNYMYWASNKKNILIVYYRDLVLKYNVVMKRILKHYKLPLKIIELEKRKFTGIGIKRLKEKGNF